MPSDFRPQPPPANQPADPVIRQDPAADYRAKVEREFAARLLDSARTIGVTVQTGAQASTTPRWRGNTLELGTAGATMMRSEPALFSTLAFSAGDVQEVANRVQILTAAQQHAVDLLNAVRGELNSAKSTLFDYTSAINGRVVGVTQMNNGTPDECSKMVTASGEFRSIQEDYRAKLAQGRSKVDAVREEGAEAQSSSAATTAAKAAEVQVLRGGNLKPGDVPAAPSGKRAGRRNPR